MSIRVLLVDDHAVVRDGVGYLLGAQPDIKVIGGVDSAAQAVILEDLERTSGQPSYAGDTYVPDYGD